ncbi:MAG: hypothetical protein EP330_02705 [Deltaproteobacteria bacterium]|nr:MAG: hypothetical protein EP330_02705 [Deltaproteobacteria bacterium]
MAKSGARWRVRWREWVELDDGKRKRRQRERWVSTEEAAIELRASVLRELEAGRVWEPDATREERAVTLDEMGVEYLRWQATMRQAAASSIRNYARSWGSFVEVAAFLRRVPTGAPVPADLLSRRLFAQVAEELRAPSEGRTVAFKQKRRNGRVDEVRRPAKPLAESTIYACLRTARDVWTWASGAPEEFPGLPAPASGLLPPAPTYAAPPAPTMAEIDACIRLITPKATRARAAAVWMRYTGLRIAQVLRLRDEDLDEASRTLTLRGELGKSKREASAARVLPVSDAMLRDLRGLRGEGGYLVPGGGELNARGRISTPAGTLRRAWERATQAGLARREVWDPPSRKIARPDHAFRAALQAHLDGARVRETTIDALVGHAPSSTRRKHYAPVGLDEMRDAVDLIPPIDWGAKRATNVVPFSAGS